MTKKPRSLTNLAEKVLDEQNAISAGGASMASSGAISGTGGNPLGGDMKKSHKKMWSGEQEELKEAERPFPGPKVDTRKPMNQKVADRIADLAGYGDMADDEILAALGNQVDNVLVTPRWVKFMANMARQGRLGEGILRDRLAVVCNEVLDKIASKGSATVGQSKKKSLTELFQVPKDVKPAEDDLNAPKEYPAFGGDPNIITGMMGTDSHYNIPPVQLDPELAHGMNGDTKRRGRTVSDKNRLNFKTMNNLIPTDPSKSVGERPLSMAEQIHGIMPNASFFYHATNLNNAHEIAYTGKLIPHRPDYQTDQQTWPDGSDDRRSYFGTSPGHVEPFYPEEGDPILLKVPVAAAKFKQERGTPDIYTLDAIKAKDVLFLDPETKQWKPISSLSIPEQEGMQLPLMEQYGTGKLFGLSEQEPTVVFKEQGVSVKVEVMNTPEGRQQGLMHRKSLSHGNGMMFVFPFPSQQKFWMKNTHMPLDMIFITSERKVLGIHKNAPPMVEENFSVPGESLYVLEVPAGFADKHGINPGAVLEFQGIPLVGKR